MKSSKKDSRKVASPWLVRGLDSKTKDMLQQKARLLNLSLNRLVVITLRASVRTQETASQNTVKRFIGKMEFADDVAKQLAKQRSHR